MTDKLRASIAICTFNRHDVLEKALASCASQTVSNEEYEIIIVDNSSDVEAAEAFRASHENIPNLHYVMEARPGLSNARNVALSKSQAPVISYIDDDAIAEAAWLQEVLRGFDTFGDTVGVVGGSIRPMWSLGRPTWLPPELEGPYTVVNWGGSLRIAEKEEWFAGANVSFSVEALKKIDGFNTGLGRGASSSMLLSNEESAAIEALETLGYQRVFAPDAAVDHLVEPDRLNHAWLRRRQAWQAISDVIMEKKKVNRDPEVLWRAVATFMHSVPPRQRTIAGLFADFEDPTKTKQQMSAIYNLTLMLVSMAELGGASGSRGEPDA